MANPLSAYGISDPDYKAAAGTLLGEGRGQGVKGYAAIADVIANRMMDPTNFGARVGTISAVAKNPAQFQAWDGDDPRARGGFRNAMAGLAAALNPKNAEKLGLTEELAKVNEALVGVFGTGQMRGITQGATFYQEPVAVADWRTGGYQNRLADRYGSKMIGSHRFTGHSFRPDMPFDPLNLNIPNPIPDLPGPLPTALNPEIPTPNVPDVPSLAGWGFPADLGQVPDVPAPFDEGVSVARGREVGNAVMDAVTAARIGDPIQVPDVPPGIGIGFPADMSVPDVPHAGADVARAVANEIKDQQERERRAEREIDRMVAANMPPDVGAPSLPGVPDASPFGFANGTTATNPGALPSLGVDLPERQMEAAIREQRIKDFEEGNYARSWSHTPPDFEKMARDLEKRIDIEAALEYVNALDPLTTPSEKAGKTFSAPAAPAPVDLAPEVSVAPAIARPTPSATVGAPTTPQAAPTPRAAAAPAPTPAPALPAPVEIREAPRVFSGPPPLDDVRPTAGTYPNPAKAPGLGFGSGTFGLPEGVLPGALMGGLFGGPVGALLGGLGGWGLGSLFGGRDDPAFGTPGAMGPFGSPFDDLGMSMPHDRHMGSLAEAQAFADSQGGWGGFGGLGDVFGGFGGRNEFGGVVDSGFGLGPESFANPRDPTGSDYRG